MNDTILRAKFKNNSEAENVLWPKPILLNKSTNKDLDNGLEVEVKQEVLSEDENTAHAEQDWEPMMDIKIEPEEISAPAPTTVEENGNYSYSLAFRSLRDIFCYNIKN